MAIGDEEVIVPSQGRVRAIYSGNRLVGYQDPDLVIRRELETGPRDLRNMTIPREVAVNRLLWDAEREWVVDSFGTRVRVASTRLPTSGSVIDLTAGAQVTYRRVDASALKTAPRSNQAYQERVVVRGVDGRLSSFTIGGRLGKKFDPKSEGKKWYAELRKSVGEDYSRGRSYKELEKFVVTRETLRATWRSGG